jgi:hypothetical protein
MVDTNPSHNKTMDKRNVIRLERKIELAKAGQATLACGGNFRQLCRGNNLGNQLRRYIGLFRFMLEKRTMRWSTLSK